MAAGAVVGVALGLRSSGGFAYRGALVAPSVERQVVILDRESGRRQ
jgi:hypothetical protein